jgi:PAS domain S-box-containing protein
MSNERDLRCVGQKHIAICETTSDITERIRMYEALHDEAQRRKILMQKSSDGIAIFDHSHRVIEANERFATMLGYSPQEVEGLHTWDFEAVFTKDQILALPLTSMNNNVIETKHRRKDGSIYPVEVSASAVSFLDGQFIFTISRDITEQKNVENAL